MCDFWCNLDLILLRIWLQINKIEAAYITIHKVYFIFWRPFKFGVPVRSHSLHTPRDAPVTYKIPHLGLLLTLI